MRSRYWAYPTGSLIPFELGAPQILVLAIAKLLNYCVTAFRMKKIEQIHPGFLAARQLERFFTALTACGRSLGISCKSRLSARGWDWVKL